jgi:hypothetical protein
VIFPGAGPEVARMRTVAAPEIRPVRHLLGMICSEDSVNALDGVIYREKTDLKDRDLNRHESSKKILLRADEAIE